MALHIKSHRALKGLRRGLC